MAQGKRRRVRCKRCQTISEAPAELSQTGGELECPECHTLLRLPPRSSAPGSTAAPPRLDETDSNPAQPGRPRSTERPRPEAHPTWNAELDGLARTADLPPAPMVGRTILGCRIESVVGQTGTGTQYMARHLKLDRPVLVKVLDPQLAEDKLSKERFLNEARTAARIDHANLVALHDVDLDSEHGLYAIVMEYVQGQTLGERVRSSGPLEPVEAVRLLIQACAGLTAAHKERIIHRDIQPDCLLVTPEGLLKVTDFGLARHQASQRLTAAGQAVGTPRYMSPEQCQGKDVDQRSDLYSLGLVGYYLLTGTEPMLADDEMATMHNQVTLEPERPHRLRPGIDPAISRAIGRMIAKDPGQRPASAEVAAAELRAAIAEEQRSSARQAPLASGSGVSPRRSSPRRAQVPSTARQAAISAGRVSSRRTASTAPAPGSRKLPLLALGLLLVLGAAAVGLRGRWWRYLFSDKAAASKRESTSPEDLRSEYEKALRQGDREAAFELLTRYVAASPSDWAMRRKRILLARDLERNDLAIDELETLDRLSQITENEVDDLLYLYSVRRSRKEAIALIQRVTGRKPARGRQLALQLTIYLERRGEHERAIEVLRQAMGPTPGQDLLRRMARLQIGAGRALAAARSLLRIPSGMDDDDSSQTQDLLRLLRPLLGKELGSELVASRLSADQRQVLEGLAARDPLFYLYSFALAKDRLGQGDRSGASKAIDIAVRSAEGEPEPGMLLAMAELAAQVQNSRAVARALLRIPQGKDPAPKRTRPLLLGIRAGLARLLTEDPSVWALGGELAARDPEFYAYRIAAGQGRLGAGDHRGALAHFDAGIKLAASQRGAVPLLLLAAHLGRAQANVKLERYRDALTDSRWCLDKMKRMGAAALAVRCQAQLGLQQTERARRTLALIGWVDESLQARLKSALAKQHGTLEPAGDEDVRRSYAVEIRVTHAVSPLAARDRILTYGGKPIRDGKGLRLALDELAGGKRKSLELSLRRASGATETVQLPGGTRLDTRSWLLVLRILDKD